MSLNRARYSLTDFGFSLLQEIVKELETSPLLSMCFDKWQCSIPKAPSSENSCHVLSFNVRGLEQRIQEVILLTISFKFDILILLETGVWDYSFCSQAFANYNMYYRKGENSNDGILILVRNSLKTVRIVCPLPNVCVVETIVDEVKITFVSIYAPESRSWNWEDISEYVSDKFVIFGDFNVDLRNDSTKAESLLEWADTYFLAPYVPEASTSLRSNRIIDYALSRGFCVDIQTLEGNTSSDHKPILSIIPYHDTRNIRGRNIHRKVFSLFCEHVCRYWETRWNQKNFNKLYNEYITFLSSLIAGCTKFFLLKKYTIAIPKELRVFLSYIRALTFRQIKTRDVTLKHRICKLRKIAKKELKAWVSYQLSFTLAMRHTSTPISVSFWSKTKRYFTPTLSMLHGFIHQDGSIIKDLTSMAEAGAEYYEKFFEEPENIVRPHPYTDAPWPD